MTREQAIEELRAAQETSKTDPGVGHSKADNILCDLLISLGYSDVVDEWVNVAKYWA